MRFHAILSLLALATCAMGQEFTLTEAPTILIAPAAPATEGGVLRATVEPTKVERRYDDVFAAEKWEQGFLLSARLPVSEAISLRQDLRTGLQSETILGDELSATCRDALAMIQRTAVELVASEALRLSVSAQQQWLATNNVPFAEIVTYGGEAKYSPTKTTTVRLQLELADRAEASGAESAQDTYRLALEQELWPKRVAAAGGVALVDAEDATGPSLATRYDASVKWTPLTATALTLAGERGVRETEAMLELRDAVALKLQQQVFAGSRLELQAGYDLQSRAPWEGTTTLGSAWNLGASSEFQLGDDWRAGIGVRYREEALTPRPDAVSFTLSVKGKF